MENYKPIAKEVLIYRKRYSKTVVIVLTIFKDGSWECR